MANDTDSRKLLLFLTAAFALSHLDRHILNITLNDIGVEFNLTDFQLGTLSGLAFAVIYVLLGFPVARLATPGRRKTILVSALGVWSFMTILMGATGNYVQLFLARVGIGIGEAGCVPPSHAMISDAYGSRKRASAMAFFSAGSNIGIFLAFLVGGIVAQLYGWRIAFLVAGLPGLVLALVMVFAVQEPLPKEGTAGQKRVASIAETAALVWASSSMRHVVIGSTLTSLVGFGALSWIATFLTRTHEMPTAQIGLYLAFVIGIVGAFGTWSGGVLSDYFGREKPDLRLKFVAVTILIAKPLSILFYLSDGLVFALTVFIVPAAVGAMFTGPAFAHIYSRLSSEQRPMATALMMFLFNLIGLGLGPVLVGLFSDLAANSSGQHSLRFALVAIQLFGMIAAVHFWLAGNACLRESENPEPN